jgi:hypothetical protein
VVQMDDEWAAGAQRIIEANPLALRLQRAVAQTR